MKFLMEKKLFYENLVNDITAEHVLESKNKCIYKKFILLILTKKLFLIIHIVREEDK